MTKTCVCGARFIPSKFAPFQKHCSACAIKLRRQSTKAWRKRHSHKSSEYYYKDHEKSLKWKRDNYKKNKDKIMARNHAYRDMKLKTDVRTRVDYAFSCAVRTALRGRKAGHSWESLVGYTLSDLMSHLESLFLPGMTWDNYGEWHIDHKIPKSKFKYKTPNNKAFKLCWSLNNLQPLWAVDNLSKGNKLVA